MAKIINVFAVLCGSFLLIGGLWGLFSDVVFGIFTTSPAHTLIHMVLGALGIVMGIRKDARNYCLLLGLVCATIGILYFVPSFDKLMVKALNVNFIGAWMHISIGTFVLMLTFADSKLES